MDKLRLDPRKMGAAGMSDGTQHQMETQLQIRNNAKDMQDMYNTTQSTTLLADATLCSRGEADLRAKPAGSAT